MTERKPEDEGLAPAATSVSEGGEGQLVLLTGSEGPGVLVQPVSAPVELRFSEDIQLGAGQIALLAFDGTDFVLREVFGAKTAGDAVSVSGSRLLIRPSEKLDILTEHMVVMGPGVIENLAGVPFAGLPAAAGLRFITDAGVELPSVDVEAYDRVIFGQTFNSTLKLDKGDDNILLINNVFADIDGSGLELRNLTNVTIFDCSFENISGTAIRLRSSGSTDQVTILSNRFEGIGRNAISAAKRHQKGVDHTNLKIVDNDIGDTGYDSDKLAHAIYVQSSGAYIAGNSIVGTTDANAISIRGDGIVWDNYIHVRSNDPYGSGIKYFADHMTGPSKTLIIADNQIMGDMLYSGVELKASPRAKPREIAEQDWLVNHFRLARNAFDEVRNAHVIDRRIGNAAWSDVTYSNWSSPPAHDGEMQGAGRPDFGWMTPGRVAVSP